MLIIESTTATQKWKKSIMALIIYYNLQGRPYEVRVQLFSTTPGGAGPIFLYNTWSVLLCVLEQPRVDNSSEGLIWEQLA